MDLDHIATNQFRKTTLFKWFVGGEQSVRTEFPN